MRNYGAEPKWDDLLIPVTATFSGGSNPPEFALFKGVTSVEDTYGLSFDGVNDYATIPHNDSTAAAVFDFAASWSVAFWTVIPAGQQNLDRLLYHPQWNISIAPGSKLRVELSGYAGQSTTTGYDVGGRSHVVMTVNESGGSVQLILYINEQEAINTIFTGTLTADGGADIIVGAQAAGSRHVAMTFDNIRFYNKVLSTTEVAQLYNTGNGTETAIADANTTCFYKCNEGTGTNVADAKYPGATTHIMTLTGATWAEGLIAGTTDLTRGVFAHAFSPDIEQELFFTVQLPHAWVEDDNIRAHVHWCPSDNQLGSVVWGLEYTWTSIGGIFPETSVVTVTYGAGGAARKHILASFGEIDGSDQTLSSMLVCRIFRKAEDAADTYPSAAYLLEIDFHYRTFNYGSDEEAYKYD